jgi:hypothetical protein
LIAAPAVVERILASSGAADLSMRTPAAGSDESGVDERMTIGVVPLFARSLNGPSNVAPACKTIVSPGFAASIAAWRLPPALTVSVAAEADHAVDAANAIARHNSTGCHLFKTLLLLGQRKGADLYKARAPPAADQHDLGVFLAIGITARGDRRGEN